MEANIPQFFCGNCAPPVCHVVRVYVVKSCELFSGIEELAVRVAQSLMYAMHAGVEIMLYVTFKTIHSMTKADNRRKTVFLPTVKFSDKL